MSLKSSRIAIVACFAIPFTAQTVLAAGYALKEQSATAQGNAFAGATADAEDISYMFFNPAALARHGGFQAEAVASGIFAQSDAGNASGVDLADNPISGTAGGDAAVDALVPAFYASAQVSDQIFLGVGVNAPFGLKTTYDEQWIGRYHALTSQLQTININPTIAYRFNDWISIGAGLQAQHADARLTNAIDTGSLAGLPDGGTPNQDSFGEVEGDDWGFGYTLGVLIEPTDRTRVGFGFRSQVVHEIEGDADFVLSPSGEGIRAATGAFTDTGATADVTTPSSVSFGVYHEATDRLALMGEFAWFDWSAFKELRIQFDNAAQTDSVTVEDWDDSLFGAIGATYLVNDALKLRAGLAFDESPIPEETRTPRIPDGDRYWVSIGASYAPAPWLEVSAGYTHIFVEDTEVRLDGTGADARRGSLSVDYDNQIDIVVLSGRIRF